MPEVSAPSHVLRIHTNLRPYWEQNIYCIPCWTVQNLVENVELFVTYDNYKLAVKITKYKRQMACKNLLPVLFYVDTLTNIIVMAIQISKGFYCGSHIRGQLTAHQPISPYDSIENV